MRTADFVTPPSVSRTTNTTKRLRVPAVTPPFHIVLVAPEIPPNTGSVARLCAATGSPLHLVRPLGFSLDEKAVRRAGVDYWHLVDVHVHDTFDAFLSKFGDGPLFLLSGIARVSYTDIQIPRGSALVFGRESTGLDDVLLERFADRVIGIPTVLHDHSHEAAGVRSLNLANAVSVVLFEAMRQVGALSGALQE